MPSFTLPGIMASTVAVIGLAAQNQVLEPGCLCF